METTSSRIELNFETDQYKISCQSQFNSRHEKKNGFFKIATEHHSRWNTNEVKIETIEKKQDCVDIKFRSY